MDEKTQNRLTQTWRQVALLINRLPPEHRRALKERVRYFNHEMGDRVGLVRSAEALLRRESQESPEECDPELLDIIRNAANDLYELLQILRAFAQEIQD